MCFSRPETVALIFESASFARIASRIFATPSQRVEVLERELLQLAVEAVQAEAARDRRVDLERLARHAPALGRADRIERAHVVQAVGELDEDDAHVARHREQHLAEVLGLRVLLRLELDAVELGDAVDQVRHRAAEARGDVVLGNLGVLDDVVQQRGDERLPVELPLREDLGDGDGMMDVGLAALAVLALVHALGHVVAALQQARVTAAMDASMRTDEVDDRIGFAVRTEDPEPHLVYQVLHIP
jgi:hypothetical protein